MNENFGLIVWAIIYALMAGFITYLLLWALALAIYPWPLIVGLLVFIAFVFGRRL